MLIERNFWYIKKNTRSKKNMGNQLPSSNSKCPGHATHLVSNDENSLYNKLGGIYGIAAVVNDFSDNILRNPMVGKQSKNLQLAEWSNSCSAQRLPGLKWMRTLWVAQITGGPYKFIPSSLEAKGKCPLSLENAHLDLNITSEEFDAVAAELKDTLHRFQVPKQEMNQVLSAFAAHKSEVVKHIASSHGCVF